MPSLFESYEAKDTEVLPRLLEQRAMSYAALAELVGCSRSMAHRIARYSQRASPSLAQAIARVLGVPVGDIFLSVPSAGSDRASVRNGQAVNT